MIIKPVRSKRDYAEALKTVEALMNAKAGTPEGEVPPEIRLPKVT